MLRFPSKQLLRSSNSRAFASAPSYVSAETSVQKLAGHIKSQVLQRDLNLRGSGPGVANVIAKAVHVANLMAEEDRKSGKTFPYIFFRPIITSAGGDQVGWDCEMLCHHGQIIPESVPRGAVVPRDQCLMATSKSSAHGLANRLEVLLKQDSLAVVAAQGSAAVQKVFFAGAALNKMDFCQKGGALPQGCAMFSDLVPAFSEQSSKQILFRFIDVTQLQRTP